MKLDQVALDGLLEIIGEESAKELIDAYITSTEDVVEKLITFADSDDLDMMRFYGHRLKGSSATLGFNGMRDLGKNIETFAKVKDTENAKEEIKQVTQCFTETIIQAKRHYPQLFYTYAI